MSFTTKKDVDTHVQDVFSKMKSEKEKSLRCWGFAKKYVNVREFATARRYLERYIESGPNNLGEAYKLMADIFTEENNLEKALAYYKAAYENGKPAALSHVCDLLRRGIGESETEETRQKWFERERSTSALSLNSTSSSKTTFQSPYSYSNGVASSSLSILTPRTRSPAVPIKVTTANGSFYANSNGAGISAMGDSSYGFKTPPEVLSPPNNKTSTPKLHRIYPSPDRNDFENSMQKRALEEKLQQTLDQNNSTLDLMTKMLEEIKNLRLEVNELKQNQQITSVATTASSISSHVIPKEPSKQVQAAERPEPPKPAVPVPAAEQPKPFFQIFKNPDVSCDASDSATNTKKESTGTVTSSAINYFQSVPAPVTSASSVSKPAEAPASAFGSFNFKPLGFGDLANNSASSIFSSPSSTGTGFTGFAGAGQPLFSGLTAAPKKPENHEESHVSEQTEDEPEEFVPTAEFEPVIPLPPLVEVKKGDEDDNIIYEVRAKLYRYETTTKEWKERGIGNVKIAQNKTNQQQIRVLMWRERVLKLACNHSISRDMVIDYAQKSEKHLTWTATDYSEPEAKLEKFLCKFANEAQCSEFKKQFEAMVNFLKKSGPPSVSSASAPVPVPVTPEEVTPEQPFTSVKSPAESDTCQSCQGGCRGCDSDSYDFSKLDIRELPTYPEQKMSVAEFLRAKQAGLIRDDSTN